MIAYFKYNYQNHIEEIVFGKFITKEGTDYQGNLTKKNSTNPLSQFLYQASRSETFDCEEDYADIAALFKDSTFSLDASRSFIRVWIRHSNENTVNIVLNKISPYFATLYYEALPNLQFEEIATYTPIQFAQIIETLDMTSLDKQKLYQSSLTSIRNNTLFMTIIMDKMSNYTKSGETFKTVKSTSDDDKASDYLFKNELNQAEGPVLVNKMTSN